MKQNNREKEGERVLGCAIPKLLHKQAAPTTHLDELNVNSKKFQRSSD